MREILATPHEILAVANYVRENGRYPVSFKVMRRDVSGYDVYLPFPVDETSAHYAQYLLDHPHPDVRLFFTQDDIGTGGARQEV